MAFDLTNDPFSSMEKIIDLGFDRILTAGQKNSAEDGITLLGLQYDDSAGAFPGSAGVTHPVLAQAVVKFQAKAYKELFPDFSKCIRGSSTPLSFHPCERVFTQSLYKSSLLIFIFGKGTSLVKG